MRSNGMQNIVDLIPEITLLIPGRETIWVINIPHCNLLQFGYMKNHCGPCLQNHASSAISRFLTHLFAIVWTNLVLVMRLQLALTRFLAAISQIFLGVRLREYSVQKKSRKSVEYDENKRIRLMTWSKSGKRNHFGTSQAHVHGDVTKFPSNWPLSDLICMISCSVVCLSLYHKQNMRPWLSNEEQVWALVMIPV